MKSVLWLLLVLFLSLALFLFWLIAIPSGTHWLVNKVTDRVDGLQISAFDGRLLDSLNMSALHYEKDGIVIITNDITFDYSLANITHKKIVVQQLNIGMLHIELPDNNTDESSTAIQLPVLTSPVHLEIQALKIAELEFVSAGKTTVVNDVLLVASINGAVLQIEKLTGVVSGQHIDLNSTVVFEEAFPININAEIKVVNDESKLTFIIHGNVNDYAVESTASMKRQSFPELSLTLHGLGSLQHLEIVKSEVLTLDGVINLTGMIGWQEGLDFNLNYSGSGIDPGQYDERYSGKIDFTGNTKTTNVNVQTDLQARGQLRGYPLEVITQLDSTADRTQINAGNIVVGANTLNVQGGVTSTGLSDFSFKINAPSLGQLSPDLSGTLTGDGSANGSWESLKLQAVLIGNSLGFSENTVDGLSLEINPTENAYEYAFSAKAIGVTAGTTTLEVVQLTGVASRDHQKLRFEISGGPSGLQVSGGVEGNAKKAIWNGVIRGFKFTANALPVYVQTEQAALQLSAGLKSLEPLCLRNRKEEFCIEAAQKQQAAVSLKANLSSFPLKRLAPWIPAANSFDDEFDGLVVASGHNGTWHVQATTSLDKQNQMQAMVGYEQSTKNIVGTVQANFNKLDWMNLFTHQMIVEGGELVANLDLAGSAVKPRINGNVDLEKINIRLPETGVEYHDVELHAQLKTEQYAQIYGTAISGGKLTFDGTFDWRNLPAWTLDLNVAGENVEVMHLPPGNVSVSPDLNILARVDGVDIEGNIMIPKAMINLGDLPDSAIKPSKDEIIIGEQQEEKSAGYPVTSNIQLLFGDQVHLSGHGLETRLEGSLQISQKPNDPVRGDGTLKLLEGTYKAYGQDLTIERGEIYFNGPLEPHLNIRATRTIATVNVVAGLQLTGTLDRPESHVFSTPAMSESDALSYLLTGKPLGGAGEGDSNLLMNAAIGLGIKGSAGLIDDIRSQSGLDTVEINAGQDSTQSYLALGKYLSPRFYIQYATKLFNASQVFSMRYQLTDKLFLEAETGDNEKSVDLMYQFER